MTGAPRSAAPDRAFTLVEVVVVIALIVVLAALVLGVGTAVVKGSEARQTTLLLGQLDGAAREWKAQSDREIAYGVDGQPPGAVYELRQPAGGDPESPEVKQMVRDYWELLGRVAAVREMLASVSADLLKRIEDDDDPAIHWLEFRDAWDELIVVVLPGRSWVSGYDAPAIRDEDGTIHTPLESRLGVARNRQTFFVSAGPDGKFGDVGGAAGSASLEATRDNIYSQAPVMP